VNPTQPNPSNGSVQVVPLSSPQTSAPTGTAPVVPIAGPKRGLPPAPPRPDQESADLFDYGLIRDYLGFVVRAVKRRRWMALAWFLAVVAAGLVGLWAFPKSYRVKTLVLAQRSAVMSVISNPALPRPMEWDTPTRAAKETVLRWDNLVALVKQTDLVDRYLRNRAPLVRVRDWVTGLFGKAPTREERVEGLAYSLEKKLTVEVVDGTVAITADWQDPESAYRLAEAAVQNFLETRHAAEVTVIGDAISILEDHAAALERQINTGMERLYGRSSSAAARPTLTGPVVRVPGPAPQDQDVVRLQATLNAKRRAISDLEEFRRRRLDELEAQLRQQQAVYAEQHPAVVTLRSNIDALSRPSPQIDSLMRDTQELEREIAKREGQAREVKLDVVRRPAKGDGTAEAPAPKGGVNESRADYERGRLQVLFGNYSTLLARIDAARVELDTARAAFKYRYSVISPPQLPKKPRTAQPALVIVASMVGGILVALFAVTVADARSGVVLERWQIERKLELPVLAETRK